jgi:hypothetical protein
MEHLTQEDMVAHNEVHEDEDDEEGIPCVCVLEGLFHVCIRGVHT